jgi:hypothetical protein
MGTSCLLWAHFAQFGPNGSQIYGNLSRNRCQAHHLHVSFIHSPESQSANFLQPNFYGKISYHGFDMGKNSYAHPPVFLLTFIRVFCLKYTIDGILLTRLVNNMMNQVEGVA